MKKIQKQIAKYIKNVACGDGLKGVHVYYRPEQFIFIPNGGSGTYCSSYCYSCANVQHETMRIRKINEKLEECAIKVIFIGDIPKNYRGSLIKII